MFELNHLQKFNHWRARLLPLLVTSLGLTTQVLAAEYEIEKGEAEAVCREYRKNLLTMRDYVASCSIPISKDLPNLQAPEWITDDDKPLPSPPNLNLYSEINRYQWERDANPVRYVLPSEWPTWTGSPQQLQSAFATYSRRRDVYFMGSVTVTAYATVDIDNDGKPEPVYRDNHRCTLRNENMLVVLKDDFSNIDRTKTERILVHPPRGTKTPYFRRLGPSEEGQPVAGRPLDFTPVEESSQDLSYGVFIYRGTTFVTVRGPLSNINGIFASRLHIYLHDPQSDREVCALLIH